MRIAHVTATFPPSYTGTGNVAYHNAVELAHRGHEVHVFTARIDGLPPMETVDGVQVHRLRPWLRYGNALVLPELASSLRGYDLVHLHLPFYGGSEAVYLLRRFGKVPLVITYHQDVRLSGAAGVISEMHDRILGTRLLRLADRACFTSLDYAATCRYAPLLAQHKIRAAELPNGVDAGRFIPGARPDWLLERLGLRGQKVVLFVGVLDRAHYFKGVPILLGALARLPGEDTSLVVVGRGDMLPSYQAQAAQLGLAGRVHFAGFVPAAELPDYYRLADVTVLPSTTMGEAFGLVLLESLACRTPVIASNLPGVRTVVDDQRDGLLVAPGDVADLARKIQALLDDPGRRREMGERGRTKVAARYAWPAIGARLEEIYGALQAPAAGP